MWRAIAPQMKPWCAEGEVPTAANLNLYRGWNSCVGWNRDDEPLFGECGDAKLIVSVSLGSSAVFRWGVSPARIMKDTCAALAMVTFLSWMAIVRMSSFIVRIPAGNKNGSTLRSVGSNNVFLPVFCFKTGVACCLPTCARGSSVPVMENAVYGVVWGFLVSSWCLVHMGSAGFASLPVVHKTWFFSVCLLLDTPFGLRSVGALPL